MWVVLAIAVAAQAADELGGLGGPGTLYGVWLPDGVLVAAATAIVARAVFERRTRWAWLAFGAAMLSWSAGSILWSVVYGGRTRAPYPTFADVLWLLWYPLVALGIALLIRFSVPRFELHRWLDGLAVTLLTLAAGFALVIQPVADQSHQGALAVGVDFAYPTLDILLIGGILGVYGLLGWRPDAMWIFVGLGILLTTIADARFAVQEARGVAIGETYDFVWTLGAVCIAYAAWVPVQRVGASRSRVTGMRAVALALVAQAFAAGIQIYAIFEPIDRSERVLTLAALVVASVQIIVSRPRAIGRADASTEPIGRRKPDLSGGPRRLP